jgi:hypothetical protein
MNCNKLKDKEVGKFLVAENYITFVYLCMCVCVYDTGLIILGQE